MPVRTLLQVFDTNHSSHDIISVDMIELKKYSSNLESGIQIGVMLIRRINKVYQDHGLLSHINFTNVCIDLVLQTNNSRCGYKCTYGRIVIASPECECTLKTFSEQEILIFIGDVLSQSMNLDILWKIIEEYLTGYQLNSSITILSDVLSTTCVLVSREITTNGRTYSADLMNECSSISKQYISMLFNSDIGNIVKSCNRKILGIGSINC
jgi:hypothetical protein